MNPSRMNKKEISNGSIIYHAIPSYGIVVEREVLIQKWVAGRLLVTTRNTKPGFKNHAHLEVKKTSVGWQILNYSNRKTKKPIYIFDNEKDAVSHLRKLVPIAPAKHGVSRYQL